MEEQRAAVHFDGTGKQTTKVVDVPKEERLGNNVMRAGGNRGNDSSGSARSDIWMTEE